MRHCCGWRKARCGGGGFYFWFELLAVCLGLMSAGAARAAGSWTPLAHRAPGSVVLMLSLPDGSVMAADFPNSGGYGKAWYRLTPDSHGSYVNGTWTALASMHDTRLWYSSQVLRDGRVFVAGGEYGTGKNAGEVYDPVADNWTM